MQAINVKVNIIQTSQPIPINASIANMEVRSRGNYREQPVVEYTTCENVVFHPAEILRKKEQ